MDLCHKRRSLCFDLSAQAALRAAKTPARGHWGLDQLQKTTKHEAWTANLGGMKSKQEKANTHHQNK